MGGIRFVGDEIPASPTLWERVQRVWEAVASRITSVWERAAEWIAHFPSKQSQKSAPPFRGNVAPVHPPVGLSGSVVVRH